MPARINAATTYLSATTLPATATPVTIMLRVKLASDLNIEGVLMYMRNAGDTAEQSVWVTVDGTTPWIENTNSSATGGALVVGTWHTLVWLRNNSVNRLYVDGTQRAEFFNNLAFTPAALLFGSDGSRYVNAEFEDIRLWNAALSATEITAETNSPSAPVLTAGLWGWWPLDGDGLDDSGNGRDLTVNGAVTWEAGPAISAASITAFATMTGAAGAVLLVAGQISQTLGALAGTGAAAVAVAAQTSETFDALTGSASAALAVGAQSDQTLGGLVGASAAAVQIAAQAAQALGPLTGNAAIAIGDAPLTAQSAAAFGPMAGTAVGQVAIAGQSAQALAALAGVAAAQVVIAAQSAGTFGGLTGAAIIGSGFTAQSDATLEGLAGGAAGVVFIAGQSDRQLDALTGASAAAIAVAAQSAGGLAALTGAGELTILSEDAIACMSVQTLDGLTGSGIIVAMWAATLTRIYGPGAKAQVAGAKSAYTVYGPDDRVTIGG